MKRRLTLAKNHISLMRVNQWYKNLVVFIPLVFSGRLFDFSSFLVAVLAFSSLCLLSSGNYAVNDIVDLKEDRLHSEKKRRPLVSGTISTTQALALALFLYALGFLIALQIGAIFVLISGLLVLGGLSYSLFFKRVVFADLIVISCLFVLRTLAGSVSINAAISPWFYSTVFLLALFLAILKRREDLALSSKKPGTYDLGVLQPLSSASIALLLSSYLGLSLFTGRSLVFFASIPIVFFVVFRYFALRKLKPLILRQPENFYKDRFLFYGFAAWLFIVFLDVYVLGAAS